MNPVKTPAEDIEILKQFLANMNTNELISFMREVLSLDTQNTGNAIGA